LQGVVVADLGALASDVPLEDESLFRGNRVRANRDERIETFRARRVRDVVLSDEFSQPPVTASNRSIFDGLPDRSLNLPQ